MSRRRYLFLLLLLMLQGIKDADVDAIPIEPASCSVATRIILLRLLWLPKSKSMNFLIMRFASQIAITPVSNHPFHTPFLWGPRLLFNPYFHPHELGLQDWTTHPMVTNMGSGERQNLKTQSHKVPYSVYILFPQNQYITSSIRPHQIDLFISKYFHDSDSTATQG